MVTLVMVTCPLPLVSCTSRCTTRPHIGVYILYLLYLQVYHVSLYLCVPPAPPDIPHVSVPPLSLVPRSVPHIPTTRCTTVPPVPPDVPYVPVPFWTFVPPVPSGVPNVPVPQDCTSKCTTRPCTSVYLCVPLCTSLTPVSPVPSGVPHILRRRRQRHVPHVHRGARHHLHAVVQRRQRRRLLRPPPRHHRLSLQTGGRGGAGRDGAGRDGAGRGGAGRGGVGQGAAERCGAPTALETDRFIFLGVSGTSLGSRALVLDPPPAGNSAWLDKPCGFSAHCLPVRGREPGCAHSSGDLAPRFDSHLHDQIDPDSGPT